MEPLLKQAGLTEPQAKAYLYILKKGELAPPAVAEALALTRSNAYKILDRLTELGLLRRREAEKKFVYSAEDPVALVDLVTSERNRLTELEQNVRKSLTELRGQYERSAGSREVETYRGAEPVAELHKQAKQQPKLKIIKNSTSLVEWIVSGDELLIVTSDREVSAIRIKNVAIAKGFRELLQKN